MNTWALSEVVLVLAGTGLRLQKSLELVASAAGKPESDFKPFLVVDFGLYQAGIEIAGYLKQFFPVDSINNKVLNGLVGIRNLPSHPQTNPNPANLSIACNGLNPFIYRPLSHCCILRDQRNDIRWL